jgi:hypothetical protein
MEEINTLNRFAVGVRGNKIVIMIPPREMTPRDAIVFAAHVVVLAEGMQAMDSSGEPMLKLADVIDKLRES